MKTIHVDLMIAGQIPVKGTIIVSEPEKSGAIKTHLR